MPTDVSYLYIIGATQHVLLLYLYSANYPVRRLQSRKRNSADMPEVPFYSVFRGKSQNRRQNAAELYALSDMTDISEGIKNTFALPP
jgi:hypothetical protein